jgi:hypothetical protein
VLELPGTAAPARLFVLARSYAGSQAPLRLAVNRTEAAALLPGHYTGWRWLEFQLAPELIQAGSNTFEFWTDSTDMDAWSLAIEGGHAHPASQVSDDAGQSWRHARMGYLNVLNGEYLVRVRLAESHDPPPPPLTWEDPAHPRLAPLRARLPEAARAPGPLLPRVRALLTWLSTSWQHTDSGKAAQFAPWDAETILSWGRHRVGQDGRLPVVMCVHYGVTLVSCCTALGIPARCAVFTGALNSATGHFAAEVWFDDLGKWVFVDPNADALFCRAGVPLSVSEIQAADPDELSQLAVWGSGSEYQLRYPGMTNFSHDNYLRGVFIRHRAVWARTDFYSRPELTPPAHGATVYCETGLIWETRDQEAGFGMFPYFGGSDYFDAPPAG